MHVKTFMLKTYCVNGPSYEEKLSPDGISRLLYSLFSIGNAAMEESYFGFYDFPHINLSEREALYPLFWCIS